MLEDQKYTKIITIDWTLQSYDQILRPSPVEEGIVVVTMGLDSFTGLWTENFDDFLKIEFSELEGQKYTKITTIDWTLQSYDPILELLPVEEGIVDDMTNLGWCTGFWTENFNDFLKIEFSELEDKKYTKITTNDWTLQSYDQILRLSPVEEGIVVITMGLDSYTGFWTENFDDFLKIEFSKLEGPIYTKITTIDCTLQSYDQILWSAPVEGDIVDDMTNLGSCTGFWT